MRPHPRCLSVTVNYFYNYFCRLLPHGLNEPGAVDVCIFTKNPKAEVKKLFEEKGVKLIVKVGPFID